VRELTVSRVGREGNLTGTLKSVPVRIPSEDDSMVNGLKCFHRFMTLTFLRQCNKTMMKIIMNIENIFIIQSQAQAHSV